MEGRGLKSLPRFDGTAFAGDLKKLSRVRKSLHVDGTPRLGSAGRGQPCYPKNLLIHPENSKWYDLAHAAPSFESFRLDFGRCG